VALFVLYALYLQFLLRYHPDLAEGAVKAPTDEETPIQLQPIESSASTTAQKRQPQNSYHEGNHQPPTLPELNHEFRASMRVSIILLISSASVVSLCAEYMVNSIEHIVANARLTTSFLGLIILPLVGNTAELFTAITVARKNKLDLAINVTVGSAIQITLFMVPAMVGLGWMSGKDVSLYFDMFQTVALLVTMMMVNFLLLGGKARALLGAVLCVCYGIIAIGAFVLPNQHGNM
jgi:Ca2+:H+ antiporter